MPFRVPVRDVAQVDVGRAPIAEQRINAPEAAFGGATARALQGVGQSLQQSAQIMGNIALELQDRQDTTEAVEAYNAFRDQWRSLDADMKKRQGVDTFGLTKEATEDFDKIAKEFSERMKGGAKRRFDSLAQQSRSTSLNVIARYEQSQSKKAFENQMGALSTTAIEDGIENFQDKNAIENSEVVINSAVRSMLRGQREEVIQVAIQQEMTKMHAGITDRLATIDPDTAVAYLEANKGKMAASVVKNLEKSLMLKVSGARAEELVAQHYVPDKPIDEITADIRKSGQSQAIKDDAVRRATNRRSVENAADRERREKSYQASFEAVRQGQDIDTIPTGLLSDLTTDDIKKLQAEASRVANGLAPVTNSKTWQDIMTMSPQELASKDIYRDYAGKLDETDFERALLLQANARADLSGAKASPKQVRESDYNQALQFISFQAGILSNKTVAKARLASGNEANRFRLLDQNYRRELDAWLANNPGKQLSRTKMVEIGNLLIADQVYLDGGFFGFEFQVPVVALTPADIEDAYIDGDSIIPEVRRAIIDAFPNRRRALKRSDIADIILDVKFGRPIDKVFATDIPPEQLTLVKAALEQQGITFDNNVKRDHAYVDLYVKGVLNDLR